MAFPATVSFPATAVFPHIPPFVTNVQKLSLSANTPVGTRMQVTDGFVVSGAVGSGFYLQDESLYNGKHYYNRIGSADPDDPDSFQWLSTVAHPILHWRVYADFNSSYYSTEDVAEPWLVVQWYDYVTNDPVSFTLTHPAVQQLTAPSTEQGGVFVLGGTQDGIYANANDLPVNTRQGFRQLGNGEGLYWDDGSYVRANAWVFIDSNDNQLYYSPSNVATPDLATNWKNASDDSPASITVTSVTQGELDAGMVLNNVFYQVTGNANGRNRFSDVLGVQPNIYFNGTVWTDGTTTSDDETVAFIWNGSGDLAGSRTDVCSEQNWINI